MCSLFERFRGDPAAPKRQAAHGGNGTSRVAIGQTRPHNRSRPPILQPAFRHGSQAASYTFSDAARDAESEPDLHPLPAGHRAARRRRLRARRPSRWPRRRGGRRRSPRSARRWAAPTTAPAASPQAAVEFEAVVETHQVNDYAHFCLGRALSMTGQTDRARHHLALASNLRPDRRDYRFYRRPARAPERRPAQRPATSLPTFSRRRSRGRRCGAVVAVAA